MAQMLDKDFLKKHKGISFVGVTTCFICYDAQGRIFMAKRSDMARDEQGRWDIGGGGLDWGLTAEANVVKEIQEEYSATPSKVDFLGYRDVFRTLPDGTSTHWLALDFAALVNPEDVAINEPDKFDDSGWFTLSTLPSPLHSQILNTFDANEAHLRDILTR
jgi:ADP-ribose pyrophosphatase YjhB (NUDIX family)